MVPLYVRFGDESRRDYVEIGPQDFYARLRTVTELPTTSQPTPGDFLPSTRSWAIRADLFAAALREALRHVRERANGGGGARGQGARRRHRNRVGGDCDARLRDSASARSWDDRRRDRRAHRALQERCRFDLHGDTLEFLQKGGRIGKAAAFAGNLLHIKPILSIEDGEVLPIKRVRGNQKAVQEFARAFAEKTRDTPNLHIAIAHAEAPERERAVRALVTDLRPQAQIDISTTLGAIWARTPVQARSASSGSRTTCELTLARFSHEVLRTAACPRQTVARRPG